MINNKWSYFIYIYIFYLMLFKSIFDFYVFFTIQWLCIFFSTVVFFVFVFLARFIVLSWDLSPQKNKVFFVRQSINSSSVITFDSKGFQTSLLFLFLDNFRPFTSLISYFVQISCSLFPYNSILAMFEWHFSPFQCH